MTKSGWKGNSTAIVILAMAMCCVSFLFMKAEVLPEQRGISLPAPEAWPLIPIAGWGLNILLLLITSGALSLVNKNYSLIPGSRSNMPGLFFLMSASIPMIGARLTGAVILAPAMLTCLSMLCSSFRSRNATQEIFIIATILAIGSMTVYAFILMIPAILVIVAMFKCLRFKEAIAFILGLFAPYWIAVGFGIISIEDFRLPLPVTIFEAENYDPKLFIVLLNLGISAILTLILTFYNSIKLYAGNPQRRFFNMAYNIAGFWAMICMIFDFSNLLTYTATFYILCALQFSNMFALWNVARPKLCTTLITLLYLGFFITAILI